MPHSEKMFSARNVQDVSGTLARALQFFARPFARIWEIASAPRIVAAEVLLDNRVVYRSPRDM